MPAVRRKKNTEDKSRNHDGAGEMRMNGTNPVLGRNTQVSFRSARVMQTQGASRNAIGQNSRTGESLGKEHQEKSRW